MIYEQAEALLAEVLGPLTSDAFFDAVGATCLEVKGSRGHPRRTLFGDEPKLTVLEAFATHSGVLDCHARAPTQPPPAARTVSSEDEFLELIHSFHERGYTVRVPDVVELAPRLQLFARALEYMLRKPVGASLFWSAAGAQAIVHYDRRDNIIVQLEGRKRWFISTDEPGLQNNWKQVGEPLPNLQRHRVVDVEAGDLLYIPRGTPHTVESTTESLHLAILFEPVTLREAIIASVDQLSDSDRTLRQTAIGRARYADITGLSEKVAEAVGRLAAQCSSPEFMKAALDLRASRMTGDLPPLPKPMARVSITRGTRVRHSPLAISWLRPSCASLDLSLPGGHIAVHPGVEPELQFIAATESFRIDEIPGASSSDVKVALVTRLIDSGFLEVAH